MKCIFITGAGAGIGRAAALRFAHKGWRVAATDLDSDSLESLRTEIGAQHFFSPLDVTDSARLTDVLSSFASEHEGRVDVVLNNAGILFDGPFEQIDLRDHQKLVTVNVIGMQNCAYAAFPFLRAAKGRLINMGSASATFGIPGLAAYSASKFYVRGLTEALSIEWRAEGIRVSEVTPGIVKTGMTSERDTQIFEASKQKLSTQDVVNQIYKAATTESTHRFRWPVDGLLDLLNRKILTNLPAPLQRFFVSVMFADKVSKGS